MALPERSLPIFPLNTVLFPNGSLPLQVFEDRYKLMMQHCLESDSRFGVVLIKSGSEVGGPAIPCSTGTVAQIVQVNRVKGGRMFISVTGEQRFRIKSITQYRPYMAAQVELLGDEAEVEVGQPQVDDIRELATEYLRLILGLRGGWVRETGMPEEAVSLSYFVAEILQVGLQEKQALHEEPSASKRVEAEMDLLGREVKVLRRRVARELCRRYSRQ